MQWAEHLYLTDKTAKKKDKIIRKANRGIGMLSIYLITLASNPQNLFDIFHAAHLKQSAFYRQDLFVVGIASGYEEALELVQEIGTKLRTHKKKAGGIAISIRNNELFTKEWQCRISIPTQSPTYLAKTAFSLFAKNYQWEHPIRSVTVRAINLFEEDCPIQYDLFTDVKSLDRQERLDAAIEQIRFRFGKDAIKNGVLFQKSKMPTERKVDLVMPTGMIG